MSDGFVPLALVARSGRDKVLEPTDPIEPVAVSLSTPGFDGVTAMGRTFVEEFAMMGWSRDRIARMFATPRYAGANAVWRTLGSDGVEVLLDEVFGPGPGRGEA
jgi:hypothetical protein